MAIEKIELSMNYGYARSEAKQIAYAAIAFASDNDGILPASIDELVESGYLQRGAYSHDGIPICRAIDIPRIAQAPGTQIENLPKDAVLIYWQWNETKAVRISVDGAILDYNP